MGMTELSASLAPRSQMKRTFLPLRPMVPSARARFMTSGMSTSVDRATAMPALVVWPRNERRVRTLRLDFCIKLLLLETLESHEHRHHAADPGVIVRGGVAQAAEE